MYVKYMDLQHKIHVTNIFLEMSGMVTCGKFREKKISRLTINEVNLLLSVH